MKKLWHFISGHRYTTVDAVAWIRMCPCGKKQTGIQTDSGTKWV